MPKLRVRAEDQVNSMKGVVPDLVVATHVFGVIRIRSRDPHVRDQLHRPQGIDADARSPKRPSAGTTATADLGRVFLDITRSAGGNTPNPTRPLGETTVMAAQNSCQKSILSRRLYKWTIRVTRMMSFSFFITGRPQAARRLTWELRRQRRDADGSAS